MKFAFAITGALASKDLLEDVTTLLSTAASEDDAVMLSVAAIRDSIQLAAEENRVSSTNALNDMTRLQDPRRASSLIEQFALNTIEAGQGLDADTREKLIEIRDILTNETYLSLEQAHRHDQDLLNKHAKAINECGLIHMRHLQQDVEGLEVQLVRDTERAMYKCRGLPHHSIPEDSHDIGEDSHDQDARHQKRLDDLNEVRDHHREYVKNMKAKYDTDLLQVAQSEPEEPEGTWVTNAVDEFGSYDPDQDPDGAYALKAVRAGPNQQQIERGVWKSGDWNNQGHRFWSQWTGVNNPKYDDPAWASTGSCLAARNDMFSRCDALDTFVKGLPLPNCVPPVETDEMAVPTCDGSIVGVDSDLEDWFNNMKENALFYQVQWQDMKQACDKAREYYDEICTECDTKQRLFESAFCSYRQGLHATCREYQGCHVLNEQQYEDLVKSVMYNADSRKIDWKAIHKIECYINVLISSGIESNEVRAKDLLNCEAGNLNSIETILTGFNETNYLSIITPEINVSCWDLDVPQYIDFKECDMSSVEQHPCTEKWMTRYEGVTAPASCTECAPIPDEFQYHMEQEHNTVVLDDFGGGWYYVHEAGHSKTDINDLTQLAVGGYHLPTYVVGKLRWNEVLIERVSTNWCDSWGRQSSYWNETGGASMCIQSDEEHVYCMNNAHGGHSWRQQPASHFTVNCAQGRVGRSVTSIRSGHLGEFDEDWSVEAPLPDCECWPKSADKHMCWAYDRDDASGPTLQNKEAPGYVNISSLKDDGSVVKISFQGQEKNGTLKVGNYNAFLQDASGCHAIGPVSYRVYVRCLGCSVEETEFHTKDGARFNGVMTIGRMTKHTRSKYTYEAWFKSPLEGNFPREIFGGANTGLTLRNEAAVPCMHDVGEGMHNANGHKQKGYQLHAGSTDEWSSVCFNPNTWYHVAVTKNHTGGVTVYVNNRDVTAKRTIHPMNSDSELATSFGGGFKGDGGQLFNVRIWDHARTAVQLNQDAFVTRKHAMSDIGGLEHWWPLTEDLKDVMTGMPLDGPDVQYTSIFCSDLEASGMRGC